MKNKNNHYVPQFHLKKWSTDGKNISLFVKKNNLYINSAPICNQASKNYLYGNDGKLEDLLSKIETRAGYLYDKIIKTETINYLTKPEKEFMYFCMLLNNERSLKRNADIEKRYLYIYNKIYNLLIENVTDFKDDKPEDYIISLDSKGSSLNAKPIKNLFEDFKYVQDLKMILLKNNTNNEFITSDYPTLMYNLYYIIKKIRNGCGYCSSGLIYIMPISTTIALMIYDDIIYDLENLYDNKLMIDDKMIINEINKLIIIDAQEVIYFSPKIKEYYIKKVYYRKTKNLQLSVLVH